MELEFLRYHPRLIFRKQEELSELAPWPAPKTTATRPTPVFQQSLKGAFPLRLTGVLTTMVRPNAALRSSIAAKSEAFFFLRRRWRSARETSPRCKARSRTRPPPAWVWRTGSGNGTGERSVDRQRSLRSRLEVLKLDWFNQSSSKGKFDDERCLGVRKKWRYT